MQRNKKQCPKCNKEISLSNYVKHINSCNGEINNKILIQEEWLQENGLYKCPHCNKEYVKKKALVIIYGKCIPKKVNYLILIKDIKKVLEKFGIKD